MTEKMDGLNKSRKAFIEYIIRLYLSMRGRYTFEGMSRYGVPCEKTHRLHFEQEFDFLSFNASLCRETLSEHRIIRATYPRVVGIRRIVTPSGVAV